MSVLPLVVLLAVVGVAEGGSPQPLLLCAQGVSTCVYAQQEGDTVTLRLDERDCIGEHMTRVPCNNTLKVFRHEASGVMQGEAGWCLEGVATWFAMRVCNATRPAQLFTPAITGSEPLGKEEDNGAVSWWIWGGVSAVLLGLCVAVVVTKVKARGNVKYNDLAAVAASSQTDEYIGI